MSEKSGLYIWRAGFSSDWLKKKRPRKTTTSFFGHVNRVDSTV